MGRGGIIAALARHRVAPNVLMLILIVSGLWAIRQLNTQFFPTFEVQVVGVLTPWSGASAEDVEKAIVEPLEAELRSTTHVKSIFGVAEDGGGVVYLEFPDSADMTAVVEDIKRRVDRVAADLPSDAETPTVEHFEVFDDVARISITGSNLEELRRLARLFESELLRLGIGKVEIKGLPNEEIQVQVNRSRLIELGLSLSDIGRRISSENQDTSAGKVGGVELRRQLRSLSKREDLLGLEQLVVATDDGRVVRLGDIADIRRSVNKDQISVRFNGKPAVTLELKRRKQDSTIHTAELLYEFVDAARAELPPGVELHLHRERWRQVQSRLDLLLKNGFTGLILVVLILFIFLNGRVAFWIAAGIPVAFMGTLFVFYLLGGSINMISMFALIMATGIIVDDAIVVGENTLYRLQNGETPLGAAIGGARKMFIPVFASSFTTVAAFLPLLVVGGVIGSIIFHIPLIIVCILIVALFECFCILPGHLNHSFRGGFSDSTSGLRRRLDNWFERFREGFFRRWVNRAIRYRGATVAFCLSALVISVGLFASGTLQYRFFPGAELSTLQGEVAFAAGADRSQVERFVDHLADTLKQTESEFPNDKNLVRFVSVNFGQGGGRDSRNSDGREKAYMTVELSEADKRKVRTAEFLAAWRSKIIEPPGLDRFALKGNRAGPPGDDIEVELAGDDIAAIKDAATELKVALRKIPGVIEARDDTPYGKEQIVFELTPLGRSLGLNVVELSAQLRNAYDGYLAQTFYNGPDEIEVRVMLTERERGRLGDLAGFRVRLPTGEFVALEEVARARARRGFDTILHSGARPAIRVTADLDDEINPAQIIARLNREILPEVASSRGVDFSFEGKQADERETIADMKIGLVLALIFIYIILTWVFSSWSIPLVIMLAMPLGVIGTVFGHWIMGFNMSILSFFGVFTLLGIIINDSIVMVRCFQDLCEENPAAPTDDLIAEAACLRLRAVLLTSLTTIGGLTPLMFERSQQAQFLIPMAISICFGLAFATFLILVYTPACLSYQQSLLKIAVRFWRFLRGDIMPPARAQR